MANSVVIDMKKRILTNLNIDIKIFFGILGFLFLVGVLLIKKHPFFPSIPLGLSAGALTGFIYLYGIDRLEIHKRKGRYEWEGTDTLLSEKVSIKIKGYIFLLFGAAFISIVIWIMKEKGIIESSLGAFVFIFAMFGAAITFLFFSSVGRLNIYKKDVGDSDEEKKVKS